MTIELTEDDLRFILESLQYTKQAFQNTGIAPWGSYPSYEFKQERIKEVEAVITKVRHGISRRS